MTSWDEIKAQHRPVRQSVRVPMRADLLDEIRQLEEQIQREKEIDKRENRVPVAVGLARRIQELETELADSEVLFVFEGIGAGKLTELIADHPATDEQKLQAEADGMRATRNEQTFQPALLALSCIEPSGMSGIDVWNEIRGEWSMGQFTPLWQACLLANFGAGERGPKSVIASETLSDSKPN